MLLISRALMCISDYALIISVLSVNNRAKIITVNKR